MSERVGVYLNIDGFTVSCHLRFQLGGIESAIGRVEDMFDVLLRVFAIATCNRL